MSCVAIVQARLGSQRYPKKVLADLHGRPVIRHVVDRAKAIRGVDAVVVATPSSIDAEAIADACGDVDVLVQHWRQYREADVLGRFDAAAWWMNATTIVRLTSDCPMLQPQVCARLIDEWRESGCEYGWLDTHSGLWPDGVDCEVFTRVLLQRAQAGVTEHEDREHVTPWMRRNDSVFSLPADKNYVHWPKVSIDTPEDLALVHEWMAFA